MDLEFLGKEEECGSRLLVLSDSAVRESPFFPFFSEFEFEYKSQ